MRGRYKNVHDVLSSDLLRRLTPPTSEGLDRVLTSTRLEDTIYSDLRSEADDALASLEADGIKKLPTFKGLSRDIFQAMYALNPRHHEETELSAMARKFNRTIIQDMMNGEPYPALKSLCEGRELPAFEAAKEFVETIYERLDELLHAAGGDKNTLAVLEKLEEQQAGLWQDLTAATELYERGQAENPLLADKITRLANKAESKAQQIEALNRMVDDHVLQNKTTIQAAIHQATQAAQDTAQQVKDVLLSWGSEAGNPMGHSKLNREILQKVRGNKNLLEIARYLGRFREMLTSMRKNAYTFDRGEKYALELGNQIQRVISSEYALLAVPETIPLFLKKVKTKTLKQYQRREATYKGSGDIIVCLDESGSTAGDAAAWGKALALALLEIARQHQRQFALIHFSGKNSIKTDLFHPGAYARTDVMAAAETFLGGGTDYETPLREALRLLQENFTKADVVFITDGECALPDAFISDLREAKAATNFTVTGLLLDKGTSGFTFSLEPFCERVYRTSELLEGDIARELLRSRH